MSYDNYLPPANYRGIMNTLADRNDMFNAGGGNRDIAQNTRGLIDALNPSINPGGNAPLFRSLESHLNDHDV